jgi:DNA-binding NarL/FixJ family response regulator
MGAHNHALAGTVEVRRIAGVRRRICPEKPLAVSVVEDDRGTRDALAALIGGTPGFRCVGTYTCVDDALNGLATAVPDVLLLDVHLPGLIGSEGVRLLRDRYPSTQVLMLTVFAEEERVFESLCNGACGYLLKKTPPARLLEAIAEARHGGSPMSPEIARKVVIALQRTVPLNKPEQALTPHETRIVRMLAEGDGYQRSASASGSPSTQSATISAASTKLQVTRSPKRSVRRCGDD